PGARRPDRAPGGRRLASLDGGQRHRALPRGPLRDAAAARTGDRGERGVRRLQERAGPGGGLRGVQRLAGRPDPVGPRPGPRGGRLRVRVNLVNPDAVFGDSGLWSEGVRQERARAHGIRADELEEFYRRRTLLNERVTAEDVAEAVLFFASDRSLKTTGCILTV